jgi:hypothetical protein
MEEIFIVIHVYDITKQQQRRVFESLTFGQESVYCNASTVSLISQSDNRLTI